MTNVDELAMARPCMCASVRRVSRALTNLYDDILAPSGLRVMQFSLLAHLVNVDEATLTRLAEVQMIDRTTLTRGLAPLERDGLVTVTAGTDRRTRIVRITDAGRAAIRRAFPYWREAQQQIITGLGGEQFSALLGEMEALSAVTALGHMMLHIYWQSCSPDPILRYST
ncbi:MAG: MarR family winged helix-turn-helix transcriptional regulator [Thermomicrobiales bacterium]